MLIVIEYLNCLNIVNTQTQLKHRTCQQNDDAKLVNKEARSLEGSLSVIFGLIVHSLANGDT